MVDLVGNWVMLKFESNPAISNINSLLHVTSVRALCKIFQSRRSKRSINDSVINLGDASFPVTMLYKRTLVKNNGK